VGSEKRYLQAPADEVVASTLSYHESIFMDRMTIMFFKQLESLLNGMFSRHFPDGNFNYRDGCMKATWGIYQNSGGPHHCEPSTHNPESFRRFKNNMEPAERLTHSYLCGYIILIPLHEDGLPVVMADWDGEDETVPKRLEFLIPFGSLACIRADCFFNVGYGKSDTNFHLRGVFFRPNLTPWNFPPHRIKRLLERDFGEDRQPYSASTLPPASMVKSAPTIGSTERSGSAYLGRFLNIVTGSEVMDRAVTMFAPKRVSQYVMLNEDRIPPAAV
jgi:hypothetical protein